MKQLLSFCLLSFLLSSCFTNTYVFTSVNSPFLDSSRTGSLKLLSSLDSKQLLANVRIKNEWMAGTNVFFNTNYLAQEPTLSRFAAEGFIARNFYPFHFDDRQLGFSLGLGGGAGMTDYENIRIPFYYEYNTARSDYANGFLQAGISYQLEDYWINAFYKMNTVYFHSYYQQFRRISAPKSNAAVNKVPEIYEFNDKVSIMSEITIQMLVSPETRCSFLMEAGVSYYNNLFPVDDYRRREVSQLMYKPTDEMLNHWSGRPQPNYVPVFFRIGLQVNMGKGYNR